MVTYNPEIHTCREWITATHCTKCDTAFNSTVCPSCGTHHSEFKVVATRRIYLKLNDIASWITYIISLGACDREKFIGYEFKQIEERT